MTLKRLNTICYTICILCIIIGTVLLVAIIWSEKTDMFLWRLMMTLGVFFLASSMTLSINKMLER